MESIVFYKNNYKDLISLLTDLEIEQIKDINDIKGNEQIIKSLLLERLNNQDYNFFVQFMDYNTYPSFKNRREITRNLSKLFYLFSWLNYKLSQSVALYIINNSSAIRYRFRLFEYFLNNSYLKNDYYFLEDDENFKILWEVYCSLYKVKLKIGEKKVEENAYFKYLQSLKNTGLSKEEEIELGYRILKNDKEAINTLVVNNLKLVIHVVSKYAYNGIDIFDLIQEGNIALLMAAERYDVTKGIRFSTYAVKAIDSKIINYFQNNLGTYYHSCEDRLLINKCSIFINTYFKLCKTYPSVEEISAEFNISLEKARMLKIELTEGYFSSKECYYDDYEPIFLDDLKIMINNLLNNSQLSEEEKEIVKLYYGFYGQTYTIRTIGSLLNMKYQTVHKYLKKALNIMRNTLDIKDFQVYMNNPIETEANILELKQEMR